MGLDIDAIRRKLDPGNMLPPSHIDGKMGPIGMHYFLWRALEEIERLRAELAVYTRVYHCATCDKAMRYGEGHPTGIDDRVFCGHCWHNWNE